MKYNVGDKVRIKSIDWYNQMLAIKDKHAYRTASNGCEFIGVWCGNRIFKNDMIKFCGQVMTIKAIENEYYIMHEDTSGYWYCDEMIEGLVEEETLIKLTGNPIKNDEMVVSINEYTLPEGYVFKDENGNVINATKIVLEKKKKEYPKTYEECVEILGRSADVTYGYKKYVLHTLQMLLVCRDAYWQIAGVEMGLDEPWEPDFDNLSTNLEYIIIVKGCFTYSSKVFAFPTEEMRDAFSEAFKKDIEICKELL